MKLDRAATNTSGDNFPPIIQKLAERFNLNPSEVQAVFEEQREERNATYEQRLKDRLDQTVKAGELTQLQANNLLEKIKSLHQEHLSEKKAARQDMRQELKAWAEENGIENLEETLPDLHHGIKHRMLR